MKVDLEELYQRAQTDNSLIVNTDDIRWNYDIAKGFMCPSQKTDIADGKHIDADGDTVYYKNGWLHRTDGPAMIYADGPQVWYFQGLIHRHRGRAYYTDYDAAYFRMGKPHRLNGPAIEFDDIEEWWVNGQRHRIDGPAHIGDEVMYFVRDKFLGCDEEGKDQLWNALTNKEKKKLSVIMHILGGNNE